ncbi:CHAT domain-containing protein [Planktothricoides raciborskii]|uniref:Tetratricopeptide repeat protein n=1 Tax=Planktothricoides raciborskii FACHB-1370 TaxID=2949576 RepID=A0ABR8E7W8_9CYAN|nr:tetratricopeptide repeat protein [Planktothricoides raciborskii]MBD2542831.1 tetratricopeptide repeat protein [Planktothricoides raciborskii FACHB-1370]MBD2581422.1 tetratricopeptide repeat protein [Planktothricoides raciborskii FACHB-1261]
MDEERIAAYDQLIQNLLECPNGEESKILKAHSDLLDPGLLQRIIAVAQYFNDNDEQNISGFLTNIGLQLGEWLGSAPQPTEIRKQTADILLDWGIQQFNISQFLVALHCGHQCLMIYRVIQDRKGEAYSLTNLGNAYLSLTKYERAIDFHQQSLAIKREIKDRKGEAVSLGNLGVAYNSLGQYERAIDFQQQSLAISREIKDRQREANSLGNLGNAYHYLGQSERAIDFYQQSLAISQEIKDRQGEANSLGSLGNAYHYLGQSERAIDFYQQSLEMCRVLKYRLGEAGSLGNLGEAYRCLGQSEQAIDFYQQSLAIGREIKDRLGEANSLGSLGNAYRCLGQYEQAIDFYQQSLAIGREIKDRLGEANSLGSLGNAYRDLQQPEKAIENYRDSLKIATPKTMPVECFTAGRNLGDIGFLQGDWELAIEGYEPALEAVEQLRKGSTTDKRRQEIIADAFSVYANAVQCYINLKQYDKAVETAERSRARHLADLFASKDLYPQGEIPPEVEEYYRLQQQSSRLQSFNNDDMNNNDDMKGFAPSRQAAPNSEAILEKITELEAKKQQAWRKIRSQDPVLAGQLQPNPLNFQDMQKLIDDRETAMLNFYTTREHTHIFILRQNQPPQVHTCEGEGLETLQNWIIENWLKPYVKNRPVWQQKMSEFLPQLAQRLQINHLISEYLADIKELIIIPHLSLHQIPFAALPLNNVPIPQREITADKTRGLFLDLNQPLNTSAKTPPQKPEYLSDKFRIRIVPSCQILNYCHQRGNLKPTKMGIVENATGDLVFTGYECETLATMHHVEPNYRLKYQQATVSNYQTLLKQVQALHSSHHASSQLDNSLESKLLLFDGYLTLGRIFTWRFENLAELFLSCCETNLSVTQITDDPLSIASGFLCAGARNVVSTLWAVDDLATALFCILYYEEKQDKSRSEALRQAQFKLRNMTGDELAANYKEKLEAYLERQQWSEPEKVKDRRLRLDFLCRETLPFVSPHYWSGFVSQGMA